MALVESQLDMVAQMFPRHMVEYLSRPGGVLSGSVGAADGSQKQGLHMEVAHRHKDVTLLFME